MLCENPKFSLCILNKVFRKLDGCSINLGCLHIKKTQFITQEVVSRKINKIRKYHLRLRQQISNQSSKCVQKFFISVITTCTVKKLILFGASQCVLVPEIKKFFPPLLYISPVSISFYKFSSFSQCLS